ncbi:MAG: beta-lactamase family protein, partial [Spirochaetales bacterium]|nr:beta-lactamase family protein [Spirochaetales bacterium]
RLVGEGRMDLDEDVSRYLGDLVLSRTDGSPARATVRQILTHTAGLTVHGFDGYLRSQSIPTAEQIILGQPPANSDPVVQEREPGEKWEYSGGGYTVLQKCVMNVTGRSFEEAMDELVLRPLEMEFSTFRQDVTEDLASGHSGGKEVEGGHMIMPELAAAGLWTTPSDLARFGIHIQKILSGEEGIVPANLVREMVREQCRTADFGDTEKGMGLGCFLDEICGRPCFGHGGDNIGFESSAWFALDGSFGFCLMVNSDDAWKIMDKLAMYLLEEEDK